MKRLSGFLFTGIAFAIMFYFSVKAYWIWNLVFPPELSIMLNAPAVMIFMMGFACAVGSFVAFVFTGSRMHLYHTVTATIASWGIFVFWRSMELGFLIVLVALIATLAMPHSIESADMVAGRLD